MHSRTVTGFMGMDTGSISEDAANSVSNIVEEALKQSARDPAARADLEKHLASVFGGVYLQREDYEGGDKWYQAPRHLWRMEAGHGHPYRHVIAERYDLLGKPPPPFHDLGLWVDEVLAERKLRPMSWFRYMDNGDAEYQYFVRVEPIVCSVGCDHTGLQSLKVCGYPPSRHGRV